VDSSLMLARVKLPFKDPVFNNRQNMKSAH